MPRQIFEFDTRKAASNLKKHGVPFREAVTIFDDPLASRPLDLSKAVRGKYYDRMQEGTNIILLAPDLIDTFLIRMPSTMHCAI